MFNQPIPFTIVLFIVTHTFLTSTEDYEHLLQKWQVLFNVHIPFMSYI